MLNGMTVHRRRLADVLPREALTGGILPAASPGPLASSALPEHGHVHSGLRGSGRHVRAHGGKGGCGFVVFCVALRGYNGHTIKPHLKMCSLISFDTCETITTVREDTAAPRGPILPLGHLRSFLLTPTPSHPPPPGETLSCRLSSRFLEFYVEWNQAACAPCRAPSRSGLRFVRVGGAVPSLAFSLPSPVLWRPPVCLLTRGRV